MKDEKIRKVTVAAGYINETRVMNYVVGTSAYGDYTIVEIEELEDGSFLVKAKNSNNELINWKKLNSNVAVTVEYSMDYDQEYDV